MPGISIDQLNPKYQEQAAAQLYSKSKAAKPRLRQDRKGPNKTEREFEKELRAFGGVIYSQAITLKLANGVRYTPDVIQIEASSYTIKAYEVKGFMRDDAAVKVKVAASVYPWIKFHLVTKKRKKDGGGWEIERVWP